MTTAPPRPWSPDVELPAEAVARLVSSQFEDLRTPVLEPFGRGWDNDAYLVNGEFVFRFPRRRIAAVCMRNEIASLPRIAGSLTLEVPRLTHVGAPGRAAHGDSLAGTYPYPFAGYRNIAGRTAYSVSLDAESRARCAAPLGRFLRELHALPVPEDAPEDPAGRKDVAMLVAKASARLKTLAEVLECVREAREEFFAEYGEVDPASQDRARLYALHCGGVLAWYGREVGDGALMEAGRMALTFAVG